MGMLDSWIEGWTDGWGWGGRTGDDGDFAGETEREGGGCHFDIVWIGRYQN